MSACQSPLSLAALLPLHMHNQRAAKGARCGTRYWAVPEHQLRTVLLSDGVPPVLRSPLSLPVHQGFPYLSTFGISGVVVIVLVRCQVSV
jgi:hypothetical protein